MFGMFPFGMGNIISFTSFTSITSTKDGINGFNVTNGFYNPDSINNFNGNINMNGLNSMNLFDQIQSAVTNVLNNVDIEQIAQQYFNAISDGQKENSMQNECDFIKFERSEDLYTLKIYLKGIDLRELSIRYNPGTLDINLNRSEYNSSYNCSKYASNNTIKKKYSVSFDNIEEIDIDRVLKSIENGVFIMKMPKKYVLKNGDKIIEVEDYTVENNYNKVIKKV